MRLTVLLLLAVIIPAAWWLLNATNPGASSRQQARIGRHLRRLGERRWLVICSSGLLVLLIRLCLLPLWHIPEPTVPDEFGYLLLADTFASGRLTNPSHPLWEHFETLFVLQQPTYASVYPVLQGFILAAPKLLGWHPWWGVWLIAGVMCCATCWALQGWLPPVWSLLGTAWVCLNLAVAGYWMNSYWGGSAGAIGGALVAGAAGRLRHAIKVRYVLAFAAGLAILANTRPYEGFLLGTTLTIWLVARVANRGPGWKNGLLRVALPLVLTLSATGAATSYYFWRVTGSPFRMPYQTYSQEYAAAPAFVWQNPVPEPAYRHPDLRAAHLAFARDYYALRDGSTAWRALLAKLQLLGTFYLGPMVLLPLLLCWRLPRGRNCLPFVCTAVTVCGILLGVYLQPHYGAPLMPFVLILAVQSLRFLWIVRRFGNRIGEFLVLSTPVICLAYAIVSALSPHASATVSLRAKTEDWLKGAGPRHVVIVHYEPGHAPADEWVYNAADIDRASIIWARDMGIERNRELVQYFRGRQIWWLLAGKSSTRILPYAETNLPGELADWPHKR
jgi:hypothetical protein